MDAQTEHINTVVPLEVEIPSCLYDEFLALGLTNRQEIDLFSQAIEAAIRKRLAGQA